MLLQGAFLLFLVLCQALPLPLTPQLSREDEKVIKCISEILADALSRPSPIAVTRECVSILREDERVLAMLHHWHLLAELKDLAPQDRAKHRLGFGDNHESRGKGKGAPGELKKRDHQPTQDKDAEESRKEEEEELEEYEKMESIKEKVNISQGEDLLETVEDQKEEEVVGKEEEEEEISKEKKSSSETWSSKEEFGHLTKRGPRQPKIKKGDQDGQERHGMAKRPLRLYEEEEEEKGPRDGLSKEAWEEERKRPTSLAKRVAEEASDEETAQFEEEEKGGKISSSKENLHGSWKLHQEGAEEEEEESKGQRKHGRPDKPVGSDFKKRHWEDDIYLKGGHQAPGEEEEGKKSGPSKAQELENLEEIERQIRWAAAKLEELKRG